MLAKTYHSANYIFFESKARKIVSESPSALSTEDYQVCVLDGFGANPSQVFTAEFKTDNLDELGFNEIKNSIGEWMLVGHKSPDNEDAYLVMADAFGFCPVFYSFMPNVGIIISTSFYGVLAGMKDKNIEATLDLDNYVATLATKSTFFANPTTSRTMANEVKIFPVDKVLTISDESLTFIPRTVADGTDGLDGYAKSLKHGIDFTQKTLKQLSKSSFAQRVIFLSGGVDSRLIFSFLLSAGISRAFSVSSADPRTYRPGYAQDMVTRDIQISDLLRQKYSLDWFSRPGSLRAPIDFKESLAINQSFRSNFSYAFSFIETASIADKPYLALRGGGGEILRSTNTARIIAEKIKNQSNNQVKAERPAESLTNWIMDNAVISSEFDSNVRAIFSERLEMCEKVNEEETLNEYYLITRNRTHFGHLRHSFSANEFALHILSSAYFKKAAQQISFHERSTGKLVRDIFQMTSPEMLQLPFEDPVWTQRLSENLDGIVPESKDWMESLDKTNDMSIKKENWVLWKKGERAEGSLPVSKEIGLTYLKLAFHRLETRISGDDRDKMRKLHRSIMSLLVNERLNLGITIAKVSSAIDVFYPSITTGASVHFPSRGKLERIKTEKVTAIELPNLPQDGWNNTAVLTLEPKVEICSNKIIAFANPSIKTTIGYRFAFYLLSENKRIETRWYHSDDYVVFDCEKLKIDPGQYRIQCFAKLVGDSTASIIENVVFEVV